MSTDKPPAEVPGLANETLQHFDDICRSLRIIYFLAAGTCLGFYRDKNYMKGDNDIDIRVICGDDKFEQLVQTLAEEGFSPALEPGYERMHFRKNDILFDIKRADGTEFQFDTIYFNGWPYRVPYPVESYLERLYGKGWKIHLEETGEKLLWTHHKE